MTFRKPVKIRKRHAALSTRTPQVHDGPERRERDAHVRGMGSNASRRGAQNCVDAVEAFDGVAALAWVALITAGAIVIVKVGAAGALKNIAANCCHVPDLSRRSRKNGAGEHRVTSSDPAVLGDGCVARLRTDQQAAVLALFNRSPETSDINQRLRLLNGFAHQVDEVGAASEIFSLHSATKANGLRGVSRAGIGEWVHFAASA